MPSRRGPSRIEGRALEERLWRRRLDIYALGAVGYFLLTASTVFEGSNLVEICSHHLHSPVEPPSARLGGRGKVSATLEAVILRCLSKVPGERPASAGELVELLRGCQGCEWDTSAAREWWRREKTHDSLLASEPTQTGVS